MFVNGEIGCRLVKSGVGDLGYVDQGFAAWRNHGVVQMQVVPRPNDVALPTPVTAACWSDAVPPSTIWMASVINGAALTETDAIDNDDITDRTMMDARQQISFFDA